GTSRRSPGILGEKLLAIREKLQCIGVYHAGAHDVHTNAALAKLLRQTARHRFEGGLRSANERIMRDGALSTKTRQADDPASVCHERYGLLCQSVQAERIRLHATPPVLQRPLQRRAENADGCVAHEDVHAIELLAENRESLGNALGAANIGLDGQRPSIKGTNVAANLFSSFVAIVINDRYVAASSRQFQRDSATDATGTSGDKRDFPCKCLAHVSVFNVFWRFEPEKQFCIQPWVRFFCRSGLESRL